jgi:hypothetical protein
MDSLSGLSIDGDLYQEINREGLTNRVEAAPIFSPFDIFLEVSDSSASSEWYKSGARSSIDGFRRRRVKDLSQGSEERPREGRGVCVEPRALGQKDKAGWLSEELRLDPVGRTRMCPDQSLFFFFQFSFAARPFPSIDSFPHPKQSPSWVLSSHIQSGPSLPELRPPSSRIIRLSAPP